MNTLEQFERLHLQCAGDFPDVGQADILAAAFNSPDVRSVESCQFRQFFLGQITLEAQATDGLSKLKVDIGHAAHIFIFHAAGQETIGSRADRFRTYYFLIDIA